MRHYILILIITLVSCSGEPAIKTYKAFWNETFHELKINQSHFNYIVEGHLGNYNINGTYIKQNDTLFLDTEKLPNKFIMYNEMCLVEIESGYEFCKRNGDEWFNKQDVLTKNRLKEYKTNQLPNFPSVELSEIFKYYETSGLVEKSPSKKYFNPEEEGIFVFYTLFSKSDNQKDEIGSVVTHTYDKHGYGWSAEDKDQTFIELILTSNKILIGQNIQVGREIGDFIPELGMPILKNDSIAIFAGSKNSIVLAELEKNYVTKIKYGTYNFANRINEEMIKKLN